MNKKPPEAWPAAHGAATPDMDAPPRAGTNGPLSDEVLGKLLALLGAELKPVQRRAVEELAKAAVHDSGVAVALRSVLRGGAPRARWAAAYTLALIAGALDLSALDACLEALSASDPDVRWAAAAIVVRLAADSPHAVRARLLMLAQAGDANARRMALYCLRDLGDAQEEVLSAAERAATENSSLLKLAALSLLSRMRGFNERAAKTALKLLESDGDPGVRRSAAVALGHIGNRSLIVMEALRRAASDQSDSILRRSAERALARLGG